MHVLLSFVCAGVRGTERPCFVSHFAHSVVSFTQHAVVKESANCYNLGNKRTFAL
jgi:hypothetical protein